jgi:hypothetical protein
LNILGAQHGERSPQQEYRGFTQGVVFEVEGGGRVEDRRQDPDNPDQQDGQPRVAVR